MTATSCLQDRMIQCGIRVSKLPPTLFGADLYVQLRATFKHCCIIPAAALCYACDATLSSLTMIDQRAHVARIGCALSATACLNYGEHVCHKHCKPGAECGLVQHKLTWQLACPICSVRQPYMPPASINLNSRLLLSTIWSGLETHVM